MLLCHLLAPHVVYKTDKKPDEPCSITSSLAYFPDEDPNDLNVTSPPRIPPSNLTVVTVEGCPSFVILDWEKSDNETRGRAQPDKTAVTKKWQLKLILILHSFYKVLKNVTTIGLRCNSQFLVYN